MYTFTIRKMLLREYPLLSDFLYEAVYQPEGEKRLPPEIIDRPELKVYIAGFGKKEDTCLAAECDGKIVGAVWARIMSGNVKGFGYVDGETPELAISLYRDYRGLGIGTALMEAILECLKGLGYKQVSLSVQKDNYAVKMYEKLGFQAVEETLEEYRMVCRLM